ncbi:MAG: hypothetical protein IKA76_04315 [Clostridia bacterium]|nr:hypothetical protein [Clostridia bacterium]
MKRTVFEKKEFALSVKENTVVIERSGEVLVTLPAKAEINGVLSSMSLSECSADRLRFSSASEEMVFSLGDDHIVVEYTKSFGKKTPVDTVKIFAGEGMRIKDFDRAFCPQPHGNGHHNMTYFDRLPDISAYGYNSPSVLEFALGNSRGWISIGLLDLPDTKECRMLEDFSFLVERLGGNKLVEKYVMPRILITFPEDEFDSISLFRKKLEEFGVYTPRENPISELPSWWKNTFFCTYGDQISEHRVGQKIDEAWIRDYVEIAETEWGMEGINLIIDDSWQLPHSFMPVVDERRFPNFRGMIEDLHQKGHHVILWVTPLFDKVTNGFTTRAQELRILSPDELKPPMWGDYFSQYPGCFAIDYTHDNARQFLREVCEQLFGDGEGQYHVDGIKIDFMGLLRDPAVSHYAHPERGMGHKELYHFYTMMYEEAKRVRPDVLIDCTVADPRFEHLIDFNRMHDTHSGTREKEIRANIAALACPNLPIDSDGCMMFNSWLATHYISSSIYGFSANYYIKGYHDVVKNRKKSPKECLPDEKILLAEEEKRALGNLFSMSRHKPNGMPHFESFGNWTLREGERINALSQKGETVIYYPTETNDTGYIFTFCDETIFLPLCGRGMAQVSPEPKYLKVDYARDRVIMRIRPGEVYTFKNENAGDGIEKTFAFDAKRQKTLGMINYVNG